MRYITLWLCGLIILVFILEAIIGVETFILDQALIWEEPWRIIISIFAHSNIGHLLSNLFALGLFGLVLEARIGPTRFFWLFILSGIIINIIPYYQRSLGASGAIYAILGTLTLLRPWMTVWVSGIPMPMIIAGGVWLTQDTIGVFVPSNVGNLAHITGLLIGICMGLIWRNYRDIPTRKQKKDKKLEKQLDKWEREHMKRND